MKAMFSLSFLLAVAAPAAAAPPGPAAGTPEWVRAARLAEAAPSAVDGESAAAPPTGASAVEAALRETDGPGPPPPGPPGPVGGPAPVAESVAQVFAPPSVAGGIGDPLDGPAAPPGSTPTALTGGGSAVSAGAVLRLALGLGCVAALLLALRWAGGPRGPARLRAWVRGRARGGGDPGDEVEVLATRSLGPRATVAVLRVGARTLVVGLTPDRVALLDRWEGAGTSGEEREVSEPRPPRAGPAARPAEARSGGGPRRIAVHREPAPPAPPGDPMFVLDGKEPPAGETDWHEAARDAMDQVRRARERARRDTGRSARGARGAPAAAHDEEDVQDAPRADEPAPRRRLRPAPWVASILFLLPAVLLLAPTFAWAADGGVDLGPLVGGSVTPSLATRIVVLLTVLSLAPAVLITLTSFTRLIVVFSFLRQAIGIQNTPPNQVLVGLALFLTWFIMNPVFGRIHSDAVEPFQQGAITETVALDRAMVPLREFMFRHTRKADLDLFLGLSQEKRPRDRSEVPSATLIPAFVISELKTAFEIGFLIYIPFVVIDMIVATTLLAMGMMVLPPPMISLPFKLLLFVMVDGWNLTVGSLVKGFGA